jgi:hypothetical protein
VPLANEAKELARIAIPARPRMSNPLARTLANARRISLNLSVFGRVEITDRIVSFGIRIQV